jgi:hypothetical protein
MYFRQLTLRVAAVFVMSLHPATAQNVVHPQGCTAEPAPPAGSRTFSQTVNIRHLGGVMITISIFANHVIPHNRAGAARTQVLLFGLTRPAFYPSGLVPARGLTCT